MNNRPVTNLMAMIANVPGIHPDFLAGMKEGIVPQPVLLSRMALPKVKHSSKAFPIGGPYGAIAFLVVDYLIEPVREEGGSVSGNCHPAKYSYRVQFYPGLEEAPELKAWTPVDVPASMEGIEALARPSPLELGWTEDDLRNLLA